MTDAATRLTPLGVMVLALLREDDMHPYEMIRLMRHRRDDRMLTITAGTVYHTVARLERAGLVAEVGTDRAGNRPERTTYTLTDAGRDAVLDWVRRALVRVDRPAELRVALAEAHNLDRDEALALLRERHAALVAEEALARDGLAQARATAVPEQYLVEADRQAVLVSAELAWLDGLLARLARHDLAWGADPADAFSDRYLAQRKAARE